MIECPEATCSAPDTTCALGNLDFRKCHRWNGAAEPASAPSGGDRIVMPWTGAALGLSDLGFVTGREKPMVVAIAGPESAGKTTLLASWYLLMGRGKLLDVGMRFNGSYSLAGWEAVAASLRWAPGQPPSFPPHTTSRDARVPGLLHLALRNERERSRDLLFADAPGAWFQKWAVNADAPDAEGARWLATHADVLLIAADREALSGPSLGKARNGFQLLAKRVAAERRDRPVALVWTKGDVPIDEAMRDVVRSAVMDEMGDAAEFTTSVHATEGDRGVGFTDLFGWIARLRRRGARPSREVGTTSDPLFLVGRR